MKRFIFQTQTCAATNKSSNPWLRVFFCFFSSDQPKAVSLVKTLLKLYLQTKIENFKFNLQWEESRKVCFCPQQRLGFRLHVRST